MVGVNRVWLEGRGGCDGLFIFAIKPQVVVVNNGEKKGLEPSAFEWISKIPEVEAIWQEHLAVRSDEAHNTSEQRIANTAVTEAPIGIAQVAAVFIAQNQLALRAAKA